MSKSLETALDFDEEKEVDRICNEIRVLLRDKLKRRGLVIAISGGVDSGVCAALCEKAVGKSKVFGLLLPETDSSSLSLDRGKEVAEYLDIEYHIENIAPTLEAIGCYKWRDEAIRKIFPSYDGSWKNKIIISGGQKGMINHFMLVVETPSGEMLEKRMDYKEYLQIVAATNFKQRIRKNVEYFHADRLNYAVIGTPNKLEYDQGFFVKNGDGAADIKPIAHLYKTQVYKLAEYMGIPKSVATAKPTTDTYSLDQGQDEFYFSLPYDKMDIALWALNNNISESELAEFLNISEEQAGFVYKDILAKRKTTAYLHYAPFIIS